MTDFSRQDLSGSRSHDVDLKGSDFQNVDLSDAQFRSVGLHRVRMPGVPDRVKMRPTDAAGFREAWDVVERLWGETVDRARRLDPALLNESVDDEWSFIQTLRHLVFATDAWIRRCILGDPSPWHVLGMPWAEAPEWPNIPLDLDARPSLDEVLELRRDRMSTEREVVDGLTDESLDAETNPAVGPGWPPEASTFPVRKCLSVILNEEWEHRLYAERDLAALQT